MRKFVDVDIIESLRAVMERNTEHYQSDFDYDVQTIQKAAAGHDPEEKCLLWMSRESGTWCLPEREVFLKDTSAYNTWQTYGGKAADRVLAFAVEIDGAKGGVVRGNLYQLDYPEHIKRAKMVALPVELVAVTFVDGYTERVLMENHQAKAEQLTAKHGQVEKWVYEPPNEQELQHRLVREHRIRMDYPTSTMERFIKVLDRDPPSPSLRTQLEQAKQRADAQPRGAGQNKAKGEPVI